MPLFYILSVISQKPPSLNILFLYLNNLCIFCKIYALLGEYKIQTQNENGEMVWEERYGLKAFSPIAKGFEYNDYDLKSTHLMVSPSPNVSTVDDFL